LNNLSTIDEIKTLILRESNIKPPIYYGEWKDEYL
jgi:hypothetical protein